MVRSLLLSFAVVVLLVVIMSATGCYRESEPLTFRYHLAGEPSTLDPVHFANSYANGIIDRIFDGLMSLDRVRNVPVPCLATSYTISDDGLVYTFQLHPEARFHNGRPLVAADVKYSWERLLAPVTGSEFTWIIDTIRGADRFISGEADTVTGIEVEDPHLVRVYLTRPTPSFLYCLTNSAATIVPREEVERLGTDFGQHPIGCGPFRFVLHREGEIVLEAFTGHHRHSPQVERLIFVIESDLEEVLRRYQNGELDLVSKLELGSLRSLRQGYAADLHFFPGANWYGFCFDCKVPPFNDRRVRRAIALALDRNALVKDLDELQHTPLVGLIPSTIPGHSPINPEDHHDPALAAELLADAGYPQGRDLGPLIYTTLPGRTQEVLIAHLQDALAELGLVVEPRIKTYSLLLTHLRSDRLSFYRLSWYGDFLDPEACLPPLLHSQGKFNYMGYSNPELDRLFDLATTEQDLETRLSLYRRADEIVINDAPCVALFQRTEAILLRPVWKEIPIGFHHTVLEIEKARLEGE
jgi:ABC-type transport system substrate-binding protein